MSLILSVLKSSLNLFNQFSADTLDESGNLWHHLAFLCESANYKIKKCTFLTARHYLYFHFSDTSVFGKANNFNSAVVFGLQDPSSL